MAKERVTLYGRRLAMGCVSTLATLTPRLPERFLSAMRWSPATYEARIFGKPCIDALGRGARVAYATADLLIEEEALVQFYDERLGPQCVGITSLIKWLKADRTRDEMLLLNREQILVRDPGAEVEAQFPPRFIGRGWITCRYQFEPGRQNDGVSITIPLPLLNRAPRYLFEWLVPGLA